MSQERTLLNANQVQEKRLEQVDQSINRIKTELEFEFLIALREANDLELSLGSDITYRLFSSATGQAMCSIFQGTIHMKTISMKEFQRELQALRKRFMNKHQLKVYEISSQKGNNLIKMAQQLREGAKGSVGQIQTDQKNSRQVVLKNCLDETLKLTQKLKEQIEILNKEGVNKCLVDSKFDQKQCYLQMICQQVKKIVFILGGPGVGKGTLVNGLVQLIGNRAYGISAGELLRREVERLKNGQTVNQIGQLIANLIKDGKIVPGDITIKLILEEIKSLDKDIIFIDGFPRNKENYQCWKTLQMEYPQFQTSICLYLDCRYYNKP